MQWNVLSLLTFNFAIRKIQEIQKGLELNRTHQLLVCVDDATLLVKIKNNIKPLARKLFWK
jgi:hypothetical protein